MLSVCKKETRNDIVTYSLQLAMQQIMAQYHHPDSISDWGTHKATKIAHLAKQDAFSSLNVYNGGNNGIINATNGTHGPSWRMIVQLDKEWPKAYGLYPGGQSGNPASPFYDNMIDKWAKGELNELLFMKTKDEKSSRISATMKISNK